MMFYLVSTLMVWFVHVCLCVCIHTYTHMSICVCVYVSSSTVLVCLAPFPPNSICVCVYSICVCVCVFGCGGPFAVRGLSLFAVSRGYSLLQRVVFSLRWLLVLGSTGFRHMAALVAAWRCSSRSSWALECGLSSCGTQITVVLWHAGSSSSGDQTHTPCTGRWILNHCHQEVLNYILNNII